MTPETILMIISGVMQIVRRHHAETGEILTDETAHAMLLAELRDGQSVIAAWFDEKGLPRPE